MKQRTYRTGRPALPWKLDAVAAATLAIAALMPLDAAALGLGRLSVQSALGETLRAEIEVTALTPEEASSLKVRVASPDVYRSSGVDYNAALATARISLERRADGRPYLRVVSDRLVQEPFVDVILELNWSSGRLMREFTLLFDPPTSTRFAQQEPAPAPVLIAPAPAAPRAAAPVPAPAAPRAAAAAPAPAPAPAAQAQAPAAARAAAPARAEGGSDEYRVQRGDTLFGIASRNQRPGVSLDQMLVALYRNNADAFIGNNMNRLKAGALLSLPSAEQAEAVGAPEARQVIQAQSADFDAYRGKLAAAVPTTAQPQSTRAAAGQVQAEVQDRKTDAAATPDRLTLSKGAAGAKPAAEEKLAAQRQQAESGTRVAELTKNVQELKRLQDGTAAARAADPAPADKPAAATLPAPAALPTPSAAPAPVPAAAPVASAPVAEPPGTAAVAAPAPASAPEAAAAASAPAVAAAPEAAAPTAAAEPAAAASAADAPAVASAAEEPGFLDSLRESSLLLPGAGLLIALLAGFGVYRLRQNKRDSGETSFLESRLQPDSFFGASGGQRVDTRDATGVPSSMSYSLSQLDAIGDVDPVAEADVYLAYGRDLQAEEILKEAMRSNPDRMAIRLKLLEVYAKRRDTKGYELLATQLYALTSGQGDDWARAQQLGQGIDADNPMYQPGGHPVGMPADGGRVVEALSATTMPQSVMPTPSRFNEERSEPTEDASIDLDLDVSMPGQLADVPIIAPERTQPLVTAAPAPAAADTDGTLEFDLPAFALDEAPAAPRAGVAAAEQPFDAGGLDLDMEPAGDEALARKLELAEEFRQIGDLEGARDLLQEVVAESGGTLKTKAQGMLKAMG